MTSADVDIASLGTMAMRPTSSDDVRASADFVMRARRKYMTHFNRRYAFFENGTIVAIPATGLDETVEEIRSYVSVAARKIEEANCARIQPSGLRYKVYGFDRATRRMIVIVSFSNDTRGVSNVVALDETQIRYLKLSIVGAVDATKILLAARVNVARSNDIQTQRLAYIALPDKQLYSLAADATAKKTDKTFIVRG